MGRKPISQREVHQPPRSSSTLNAQKSTTTPAIRAWNETSIIE